MISIIIPVYNAEKYLEQTLKSLVNQTLKNFEVIMVDDSSNDRSLAIMKRYEECDSRFRIIRQPNGGPSAARNTGIDNARGEWIYFIDADDTARHDALERLLIVAETTQAPVVIGGYFESESENWPQTRKEFAAKVMTAEEVIKIALYQKRRINNAWGVLISTDILKAEKFTEGLYYEDLDFFPRMCIQAGQIAYYPEPLYFYRQHSESFIHTFSPRRLDSLRVTDRILTLIRDKMLELERAALDRQMSAAFNVLLILEKHRPSGVVPAEYSLYGATYGEVADYCYNIIRRNRSRSLYARSVRLKNRLGALLSYGGRPTLRLLARFSR